MNMQNAKCEIQNDCIPSTYKNRCRCEPQSDVSFPHDCAPAPRAGKLCIARSAFCIRLLLVLTLLLTLTACHGSAGLEQVELPAEFDETRQYEITFWAKNESNLTQANIYRQAIEDFQALYPNITVKLKIYTDYGRIYNDVITNIATSTTPNVCITYPDHIATYLTGGNTVVALDSLMADPRYGLGGSELRFDGPDQGQIVEKFLAEGVIRGKQYALPYMRSTEACYINKTYVEKLGYTVPDVLTWDFIWEVSEAAMAKDENGNFLVNGQSVMIPFIYKSTDNMMIQYLAQKQAGYVTAEGEILLFNDTAKELLQTVAEHAKARSFSTFKISSYPGNFLNAGQCIFGIDSTAGATWMGPKTGLLDIPEESVVDFEMVVRPVPQVDPENPKMISQGPSICIFNKEDPQEVLASWLFVQYMLTNQVQIPYAQTEGYVPVTTKAQESAEYLDYLSRSGEDNELYYSIKLDATKLLLENMENTFITPVFNGSASVRDAAGQLIENTAKGMRRGGEANDAFFDALYTDVQALYRLNQGHFMEADPIPGSTDPTATEPSEAPDATADLGPLPDTAAALLVSLAIAWAGILLYVVQDYRKKRKAQKKH